MSAESEPIIKDDSEEAFLMALTYYLRIEEKCKIIVISSFGV